MPTDPDQSREHQLRVGVANTVVVMKIGDFRKNRAFRTRQLPMPRLGPVEFRLVARPRGHGVPDRHLVALTGRHLLLQSRGRIALTDDVRKADDDHPQGSYEFEAVKKTKQDASWIEQARGKVKEISEATDIYSLGAILYELLTGRPPLVGESDVETLQRVQTEEPIAPARLRPKLPRDLATICIKCLEKEPRRRYVSAAALADDLRRFLDGQSIQARPTSPPMKTRP